MEGEGREKKEKGKKEEGKRGRKGKGIHPATSYFVSTVCPCVQVLKVEDAIVVKFVHTKSGIRRTLSNQPLMPLHTGKNAVVCPIKVNLVSCVFWEWHR